MVLGKEFLDEMITRLLIIVGVVAAVLLIIIVIAIWKSIAGKKIKKAILALSEHPNDEQAGVFVKSIGKISPIGRFFAKLGKGFSGLSKSECRTIFNSTFLSSEAMGAENKKTVRECLMKLGCNGLTDINE